MIAFENYVHGSILVSLAGSVPARHGLEFIEFGFVTVFQLGNGVRLMLRF